MRLYKTTLHGLAPVVFRHGRPRPRMFRLGLSVLLRSPCLFRVFLDGHLTIALIPCRCPPSCLVPVTLTLRLIRSARRESLRYTFRD